VACGSVRRPLLTRGFGIDEVRELSRWMCDILTTGNEVLIQRVRGRFWGYASASRYTADRQSASC
jgi:hypothetical protein